MKWRHYVVLGGLSYVFFLLASLPASVLWQRSWVQQQVQPLASVVSGLRGSLWRGTALLQWNGENYSLAWQVSPRWLWRGELALDLSTEQPDLQADAVLIASPFSLGLRDLKAKASDVFVNRLLVGQGVSLRGVVSVDVQRIRWKNHLFSEAQGRVSWDGGLLRYPTPAVKEVTMPRLLATLSSDPNGQLVMNLVAPERSATEELLLLRLNGQGLGTVQVRRRFLDVLGQPWGARSKADDVVFEASQQF